MIIHTDKPLNKRNKHDFYPTPLPVCIKSLNVLPDSFTPSRIIDPGAGGGRWGAAARRKWGDSFIEGVDIRPLDKPDDYDQWSTEDFRLYDSPYKFDLVMGNPPFSYAEYFIREGLKRLDTGGYLMFLLRLAFLEGKGRAKGLYKQFPLQTAYVVGRVSFIENSKTDETAYGLFVWQKGYIGESRLSWDYFGS